MSLVAMEQGDYRPSFPRVSGDEPTIVTTLITNLPFSPRERG